MLYPEQPTVLLARRHLSTMLFPNFETLNSIMNISLETHNFLVLTWVLLNRAPTSIHLHPAPPTSTQLILTFTLLHPPPPSSFQPPPSSLHHPQQYFNQNIACNWAISTNLGRKSKSCPFWLKIGTHGILEVLIPNPDLDFWKSNPKIYFWANLDPKIQSSLFCLKIGAYSISRMLIPNPDLDFWNFEPKIQFRANLGQKSQSCSFCLKIGTHGISRMLILIAILVFWISNPNFLFGQICVSTECQH